MKRILFFVDGFNIYHALDDDPKYHKYKWLDYSNLAKRFVSKQDQIVGIFYFTAYAHWNPQKMARHQLFVRALMATGVKVVFGKFKNRDHECRLCKGRYSTFEEKQTDVNIAIKLFQSAINNDFDTAIIISGDSDLIPAIEAVKATFPTKQIGLVVPIGRRAKELMSVCDFRIKMKEIHLRTSQFPDTIVLDPIKNIVLQRPPSWK
jgi:uncharacterized LabA/DUF88 family protein